MKTYRLTRRAFLSVISAIIAVVAMPFRRWLSVGNELIGDWSVVEYVCDGKAALTTARDVSVSIAREELTIRLQMPDMPEYKESCRYTVQSSTLQIDIRNPDDTATFEGVYCLNRDCLALAWDTVGKGRPSNIMEADRFGLNRMTLRRG